MEERIEKHREFLVDRIDTVFGLLDKLLASRILTREALHKIKLKDNTAEDKNRILLDFILKNKKAKELVSALGDSGQNHLVNYLNSDGDYKSEFGDDWPLPESDIGRLEINRESLIDLLDTNDLCIRLYSEKVINNRQRDFICSKMVNFEKNEVLLDIMTTFSLRQYKRFIACLNDFNQSHIAKLLSEGGVIVRVHANLEGAIGNIDKLEDEVISKIATVLEHHPLNEAIRLLDQTKLGIIAARKGQSIVIYILCRNQDELLQLTDFLKTDKLREIVERVFIEILSIGDALRVSLTWSLEEFAKAVTYFESADSFDSPTDGTTRSQEGKQTLSLKLPSVATERQKANEAQRQKEEVEGAAALGLLALQLEEQQRAHAENISRLEKQMREQHEAAQRHHEEMLAHRLMEQQRLLEEGFRRDADQMSARIAELQRQNEQNRGARERGCVVM